MRPSILRFTLMLFVLAFSVAPTRARAVDLGDTATGFRMNLDAAGAKLCIAYPAELRNEAACPEINMPSVERVAGLVPADAAHDVRVTAAVFFVANNESHFMLATGEPRENGVQLERSDAETIVRDFVHGLLPNAPAPASPQLVMYNLADNVQVVRHLEALAVPATPDPNAPTHVLVYHLNGGKGLEHLIFYSQPQQLAAVMSLAEAVVHTVTMPRPVPRAEMLGRSIGRALCPLMLLAGIGGLVAFLARRKSGGPPAPPPSMGGGPGAPWQGPGAPWQGPPGGGFGAPPGGGFGAPPGGGFGAPTGSGGWNPQGPPPQR